MSKDSCIATSATIILKSVWQVQQGSTERPVHPKSIHDFKVSHMKNLNKTMIGSLPHEVMLHPNTDGSSAEWQCDSPCTPRGIETNGLPAASG